MIYTLITQDIEWETERAGPEAIHLSFKRDPPDKSKHEIATGFTRYKNRRFGGDPHSHGSGRSAGRHCGCRLYLPVPTKTEVRISNHKKTVRFIIHFLICRNVYVHSAGSERSRGYRPAQWQDPWPWITTCSPLGT